MTGGTGRSLPTTLDKRELLYGKGSDPQTMKRLGEDYLREGHPDEAICFFKQAKSTADLERIASDALAGGDCFTFIQARHALDRPPTREEWLALAKAARIRGLDKFAQRAEGTASSEAAYAGT